MEKTEKNYQGAILAQLLAGKRISVLTVLQSVGTSELRHFISIIRSDGLPVADERIKRGDGVWYKEYFLEPDVLEAERLKQVA